jgi:hypothetical protein
MKQIEMDVGRQRVKEYLKTLPFPHFEAAPGHPGLLVRIEADGTRTVGRFVNRIFKAVPTSSKRGAMKRCKKSSP